MGLVNEKRLAIATWIAIIGTLAVNTLSNIFPIGGNTVADLANGRLGGVLITPESYAFTIWGVIYVGLIVYGFYQIQPRQRRRASIRQVNRNLIVACGAQILWIFLFTLEQFWLSVAAMLVILVALTDAYLVLADAGPSTSQRQLYRAYIPFSIYLGWISVATVVNIASAFYASGFTRLGWEAAAWTATMTAVANLIAAVGMVKQRNFAFALVFVWADIAIAVRHLQTWVIWVPAVAAAALLVALMLYYRRYPKKSW